MNAELGAVSLARRYDMAADPQFAHGCDLVELLAPRFDDCILDVGCGTGRLAIRVLDYLGARGRIVGIDPASARIGLAQHRRDTRLEFRVGRAENLSAFGTATLDIVYLNSALDWVQDRPRAMAEIRRVLKPGGRLGIATTVRERRNELWRLTREARRTLGQPSLGADAPDAATQVGAQEHDEKPGLSIHEVRELLRAANLAVRVFECRTYHSPFYDSGQIIEFLDASTEGSVLRGSGLESGAAFRDALDRVIARTIPVERRTPRLLLERYILLVVADKTA